MSQQVLPLPVPAPTLPFLRAACAIVFGDVSSALPRLIGGEKFGRKTEFECFIVLWPKAEGQAPAVGNRGGRGGRGGGGGGGGRGEGRTANIRVIAFRGALLEIPRAGRVVTFSVQ
jgi:hypothetical protein